MNTDLLLQGFVEVTKRHAQQLTAPGPRPCCGSFAVITNYSVGNDTVQWTCGICRRVWNTTSQTSAAECQRLMEVALAAKTGTAGTTPEAEA